MLHRDHGDGLEVQEQRHGVCRDVRCGCGVPESGQNGRGQQPNTGYHCGNPFDTDLRNGLPVGEENLDTRQILADVVVNVEPHVRIDIRHLVRNLRNHVHVVLGDVLDRVDLDVTGVHGTELLPVHRAHVEVLGDDFEPVRVHVHVRADVRIDLRGHVQIIMQRSVVWRERHLEAVC